MTNRLQRYFILFIVLFIAIFILGCDKTPVGYDELGRDILSTFHYISANDSDVAIFMKLWSKIDMIPLWIAYDKARCKEILKML